jgi:hypothetical protein
VKDSPTKQSLVINEYGAAVTPLIKDLDALLDPMLKQVVDWAMNIPEMDGHDWAIVRTYIIMELSNNVSSRIPVYINPSWLRSARTFGQRIHKSFWEWPNISRVIGWEYFFCAQYVYAATEGMCATVQMKKANLQRKAKRDAETVAIKLDGAAV